MVLFVKKIARCKGLAEVTVLSDEMEGVSAFHCVKDWFLKLVFIEIV